MAIPTALKKRIEALENSFDLEGRRAIKVFIYHPEEDIPYWDPEPPDVWQEAPERTLGYIRSQGLWS